MTNLLSKLSQPLVSVPTTQPQQLQSRPPSAPVSRKSDLVPATVPAVSIALDVSKKERNLGRERAEFLRAVKDRKEARGESEAVAVAEVARDLLCFPHLVTAGKNCGSALKLCNYRKWKKQLAKAPLGMAPEVALIRRYHRGVRAQTADAAHPFIQLVSRYYEHANRLSLKHCFQMARTQARSAKMPTQDMLTYHQVHYYYTSVKDRQGLYLARQGEAAFVQDRCGYIQRDWSAIAPGECWIGDHHVFDAPCRIWSADKNDWVAVRPWLTGWLDARSLYMAGWAIRAGEHPDSRVIEDALLHGINQNDLRPPQVLYTDNGADYKARGLATPFVASDGSEHSIMATLGCNPKLALPYNARAKTIERIFGNVAAQFSKWFPGYLGNQPKARPERAEHYYKNPGELPDLDQYMAAFTFYLETVYHETAGESKITDGRKPAEVWASRPALRQPMSKAELYFAFLRPVAMRKVDRGGVLRHKGRRYQTDALWPRIGDSVMMKVDRFSDDHVFAFEADGRFLCKAVAVQALDALNADPELLSGQMAHNRRLLTHARAIQKDDHGGQRILPAAYTRLALENPAVDPDHLVAEAHRAEVEAAAQGGCSPTAPPAQPPCNDVSDVDLEAFQAAMLTEDDGADRDDVDLGAFRDFLQGND